MSRRAGGQFSGTSADEFKFALSRLPTSGAASDSTGSGFSIASGLFVPYFVSAIFVPFLSFFSASVLSLIDDSLDYSRAMQRFSPSRRVLVMGSTGTVFPTFVANSIASGAQDPLNERRLDLRVVSSGKGLSSSDLASVRSFAPLGPDRDNGKGITGKYKLGPSMYRVKVLLLYGTQDVRQLESEYRV